MAGIAGDRAYLTREGKWAYLQYEGDPVESPNQEEEVEQGIILVLLGKIGGIILFLGFLGGICLIFCLFVKLARAQG